MNREQSSALVPQTSTAPFDSLMGEDGRWSARDLQSLMGYVEWRNLQTPLERAIATARNQGLVTGDHFVDSNKMVEVGSGALREVEDYRLTRVAAYLLAMNGDPNKPEIAAAQMYFAVKTREAEQPKSELELARDYVRALEAKEELRTRIAELEPKAGRWDKYLAADGLMGMRELADLLGLNVPDMTSKLVELNIFRRQTSEKGGNRNMPRRTYQLSGHFVVRIEQSGPVRFPVAYATASGVEFVVQHLGR